MNAVRIFEISDGGYTGSRWLCPDHAMKRAKRWAVKPGAMVPHDLTCDDCLRDSPISNAPVDYVPPDPNSILPTRDEVQRMPGVAAMQPWAAYMAEKRQDKAKRKAA